MQNGNAYDEGLDNEFGKPLKAYWQEPAAGAEPYKRDLQSIEFHLLDAGHFALESEGDQIARLMLDFFDRHVVSGK